MILSGDALQVARRLRLVLIEAERLQIELMSLAPKGAHWRVSIGESHSLYCDFSDYNTLDEPFMIKGPNHLYETELPE